MKKKRIESEEKKERKKERKKIIQKQNEYKN